MDPTEAFDRAGFALHVVAPDGTIADANAAALALLGQDRAGMVGRHLRDIHADPAAADDLVARLATGDGLRRHPARLLGRDGAIRDVEITSGTADARGTPCLLFEAQPAADVSRSEEFWRAAMEEVPAAIYVTDAEGRITHHNRAAAAMAGRAPQAGSDQWSVTWRLFNVDGTPLPADECPMAIALKEDRPVRGMEAIAERPDGTRVRFQPFPTPLHDRHGRLIGAVNLLVDVTEQRRAEEDAARLAAIVTSSNDAIVSKTLDGIVTSWNAAAEQMFGFTEADIVGGSILRIIPADRRDEERDILARLRRGERIEHYETVRLHKDGSPIDVSLSISPVRDRAGHLVGASKVARDITQRRQAEETQRLLLHELNHRVRNTLATVQSIASQTLRQTVDPAGFVTSFTGRVEALANAHGLLTQTSWQGAELGTLIRNQLIADDIADRIGCEGPKVMLPASVALHLGLVLHELGTNARKHGALSTPRGRVALCWEIDARPGPVLQFTWIEAGGPPIEPGAPPRRGFGTELIEHSIRAIAGGDARMQVEDGGIAWHFALPLPAAALPATETPKPAPFLPALGREATEIRATRVLVVEDEPIIGLDIVSSLNEGGYRATGPVPTLAKALHAAATGNFGAALLDANLGGEPVDELAALLTERNIPFTFVTGYGRDNLPAAYASAPALGKPFARAALLRAVGEMFARPPRGDRPAG